MQFGIFYIVNLSGKEQGASHAHDHWEIVFVHKSGGHIEMKGQRYPYKSGDLLIHSPGVRHLSHSKYPGAHYCLGMTGNELSGLKEGVVSAPAPIRRLFESMAVEIRSQRPHYREIIASQALEAGWLLLRSSHNKSTRKTPQEITPAGELKTLLDHQWQRKTDVGDLCGQLLMSKDYLRHLFKKAYGISPVQYMISKRIDHASTLLATTGRSVKSIAFECGFESEYYFSRLFSKTKSLSPLKFRQKNTF